MNIKRKILLIGYSIALLFAGILSVPVKSIWGLKRYIDTYKYVPIWKLVDTNYSINGENPVFEIDISRLVITLIVITLITAVLYLVLDDKKSCSKHSNS